MEGHNGEQGEEPAGLKQALNLPVDQAAMRKGPKRAPQSSPEAAWCQVPFPYYISLGAQEARAGISLLKIRHRDTW